MATLPGLDRSAYRRHFGGGDRRQPAAAAACGGLAAELDDDLILAGRLLEAKASTSPPDMSFASMSFALSCGSGRDRSGGLGRHLSSTQRPLSTVPSSVDARWSAGRCVPWKVMITVVDDGEAVGEVVVADESGSHDERAHRGSALAGAASAVMSDRE
jgi:hypothetical protein